MRTEVLEKAKTMIEVELRERDYAIKKQIEGQQTRNGSGEVV